MESFSVILCVYAGDDASWFRDAFESLVHQSVPPAEIVLVVDGPVPEVLEQAIGNCLQHPVCRVIRLPENRGHGLARAAAVEACRCDLVALMDADDLSLPDRFQKQLGAFDKEPELAVLGGQIGEFEHTKEKILGYRRVQLSHEAIFRDMKRRCPMNQVTVMLRKSALIAAGGYRDRYCNEDYDLWIRMAQAGCRFRNLPEPLVLVRVGAEMYRRRSGWRYFCSEAAIQRTLRKQGYIGTGRYIWNLLLRFGMQLLLPHRLRGWIFRKFTRKAEWE